MLERLTGIPDYKVAGYRVSKYFYLGKFFNLFFQGNIFDQPFILQNFYRIFYRFLYQWKNIRIQKHFHTLSQLLFSYSVWFVAYSSDQIGVYLLGTQSFALDVGSMGRKDFFRERKPSENGYRVEVCKVLQDSINQDAKGGRQQIVMQNYRHKKQGSNQFTLKN